jgi:hypothetical protein
MRLAAPQLFPDQFLDLSPTIYSRITEEAESTSASVNEDHLLLAEPIPPFFLSLSEPIDLYPLHRPSSSEFFPAVSGCGSRSTHMVDPSRLALTSDRLFHFSYISHLIARRISLLSPLPTSSVILLCVCSALAAHETFCSYRTPIPPSPLRLLHALRSY